METNLSDRDSTKLLSSLLSGAGCIAEARKAIEETDDNAFLREAMDLYAASLMQVARELAVDRWGGEVVDKLDNIQLDIDNFQEGESGGLSDKVAEIVKDMAKPSTPDWDLI